MWFTLTDREPALIRLQQQYGPKGFTIVGPTQRYGTIGGEDATPERETRYIEEIRRVFYGGLQMYAPLSEENFKAYGSSSSPTLVRAWATVISREIRQNLLHLFAR